MFLYLEDAEQTKEAYVAADTATEYDEILDLDGEEFEEQKGSGGDFPPTWDFDENPKLIAVYAGSKTINVKGDDRTIHTFSQAPGSNATDIGEKGVEAWGTTILDDRIKGLDGEKVLVDKTGKKLGRAWEFRVYVSRQALAR